MPYDIARYEELHELAWERKLVRVSAYGEACALSPISSDHISRVLFDVILSDSISFDRVRFYLIQLDRTIFFIDPDVLIFRKQLKQIRYLVLS